MEGVNIFEEKEKRASTDLWCGTNLQCLNLHAPFLLTNQKKMIFIKVSGREILDSRGNRKHWKRL